MRKTLALALLLLATGAAAPAPKAERQVRLAWNAVPLDVAHPNRRQLGRLIYLGGWELRSRDPDFGGISAMHVEGRDVLAVSDAGSLIRFALQGTSASIRPLPAGPGAVAGKKNGDSESLVVQGNRAWIGFERANAIFAYRWPGFAPAGSATPRAMRNWPVNGGAEAMLRLPDGRFLVFSEEKKRPDGTTEVLLFDRDPTSPAARAVSLGYRAPPGYKVTDATLLPDGRLLILNRRYVELEGVSAKLVVAKAGSLQAGAVIAPTEIADLRPPVSVDNMEALSVTREGGRTIIWIASDDNFSALQRSLLLKFAFVA